MIHIVIPNYNGLEHLRVCLQSLKNQTYKSFKVILVDNNSTDNSVNYVRNNFPEVDVLELDTNYGFAYPTNLGIKESLKSKDCKYILFLNNDIECAKDFLEKFLTGFISDKVGSVACKMMNYYERNIFDSAGDYFDLRSYPYKRGFSEIDEGQYDERGYIFGACGGAAIYRREVFERIGFLDNSFFAYYEDIDLNFRMQLSGYKCFYIPEAICYHKSGATIKKTHGKKFFLMERNLTSILIKNYQGNLLLKHGVISIFSRLWNYLRFLKKNEYKYFFYSLVGFIAGLRNVYSNMKKRKEIKMNISSSMKYIENICMDFKSGYKELKMF